MATGVKRSVSYEDLKDLFKLEIDWDGNPTLYRRNLSGNSKWKYKGDWLKVNIALTKYSKCLYKLIRVSSNPPLFLYLSNILYSLHSARDIPANMFIDHIDGDPTNNNLNNLRLVTPRENCQNLRKHREGNPLGIYYSCRDDLWYPQIKIKGKSIRLGGHKSMEVAQSRYFAAIEILDVLEDKSPALIKKIVLHYLATNKELLEW